MKHKNILLGAHISIAGGFDKAIQRAEATTANCMQIFTKSNRQWFAKPISEQESQIFIKAQQDSSVSVVVAHAAYLINLGSQSDATVKKSTDSLALELERCEQLNIPYLVLHPGTSRYEDEDESLKFIAQQIDVAVIASKTKKVLLLLETMAGQGNTIGYTFEQLATIIKYVHHKNRIGICFDTCHAFAAGYDFHTPELYKKMWHNFDQLIGLERLKVFHINDSKKELGSNVDRHEDIGHGKIPLSAFSLILHDNNFANIPKIIETPEGSSKIEHDKKNLETLRELI